MFDSFWPHRLQIARLPCTSVSPSLLKFMSTEWVMEPSYWTTHYVGTISSFVPTFSSCHQPFPASGSFPMSWLFPSGGQSIGASASTSVLPMNIQGWFPLWLTGLISLQSKGLSRVFSNKKHQFFSTQPSLWSNSHFCTWLLKNHSFNYTGLCCQSNISAF